MAREIIFPTPFHFKGPYGGAWANPRTSNRRMGPAILAASGATLLFSSFMAYAQRRCLYVYQRHDPRNVHLPWEEDFIKKHSH